MTIQKRINVPDIDLLQKNHHKHKLHACASIREIVYVRASVLSRYQYGRIKHRFCKPHQVEVDNKTKLKVIEEDRNVRIQKEIAKRNRRY